jgi:hypothetical protein
LSERLGRDALCELFTLGNPDLLRNPTTALFCSARCPGDRLLSAYDQAARWRDTGRCVIGGFHAPVEKACLRILLRGRQPIIVCPARGLPQRLAPELRAAFDAGRVLVLTPFAGAVDRVTAELADRRNEVVAALADEVWFAHITPGGRMARLAERVRQWTSP